MKAQGVHCANAVDIQTAGVLAGTVPDPGERIKSGFPVTADWRKVPA
jgi:hypothetical protein